MGDEKALVTTNGAALVVAKTKDEYRALIAQHPDYIPGAELVEQDDLPFAMLKLIQAQTPDVKAEPGTWYHTITGQAYTKFAGVLLSFAKGRIAFAEYGSENEAVLCGSNDALYPRRQFVGTVVHGEEITGGPCAECPLAQFGANGEAPSCSKVYSFALLDKNFHMPVVASLKRSGVKAAKTLAYLVRYPTAGRNFYVVLGSEKVTDEKKRTYFVPTVEIGEATTDDDKNVARGISMSTGNLAARVDITEEDAVTKAAQNMGGVVSGASEEELPW